LCMLIDVDCLVGRRFGHHFRAHQTYHSLNYGRRAASAWNFDVYRMARWFHLTLIFLDLLVLMFCCRISNSWFKEWDTVP
jgi:hypothetical protein